MRKRLLCEILASRTWSDEDKVHLLNEMTTSITKCLKGTYLPRLAEVEHFFGVHCRLGEFDKAWSKSLPAQERALFVNLDEPACHPPGNPRPVFLGLGHNNHLLLARVEISQSILAVEVSSKTRILSATQVVEEIGVTRPDFLKIFYFGLVFLAEENRKRRLGLLNDAYNLCAVVHEYSFVGKLP